MMSYIKGTAMQIISIFIYLPFLEFEGKQGQSGWEDFLITSYHLTTKNADSVKIVKELKYD